MGFRSTVTSEHLCIEWPEWFREKYSEVLFFADTGNPAPLASRTEAKTYGGSTLQDIPEDIRRAIDWTGRCAHLRHFVLVYLHECGGVSRCEISQAAVRWSEPIAWVETTGVTHSYCHGCSDVSLIDQRR